RRASRAQARGVGRREDEEDDEAEAADDEQQQDHPQQAADDVADQVCRSLTGGWGPAKRRGPTFPSPSCVPSVSYLSELNAMSQLPSFQTMLTPCTLAERTSG